jgi:hypothetical protein
MVTVKSPSRTFWLIFLHLTTTWLYFEENNCQYIPYPYVLDWSINSSFQVKGLQDQYLDPNNILKMPLNGVNQFCDTTNVQIYPLEELFIGWSTLSNWNPWYFARIQSRLILKTYLYILKHKILLYFYTIKIFTQV